VIATRSGVWERFGGAKAAKAGLFGMPQI
jgi:hypothetical protein